LSQAAQPGEVPEPFAQTAMRALCCLERLGTLCMASVVGVWTYNGFPCGGKVFEFRIASGSGVMCLTLAASMPRRSQYRGLMHVSMVLMFLVVGIVTLDACIPVGVRLAFVVIALAVQFLFVRVVLECDRWYMHLSVAVVVLASCVPFGSFRTSSTTPDQWTNQLGFCAAGFIGSIILIALINSDPDLANAQVEDLFSVAVVPAEVLGQSESGNTK